MINLHLISDSTCDTLLHIAQSCINHFEGINCKYKTHYSVRTKDEIDRLFEHITKCDNNFIMCTIVSTEMYNYIYTKATEKNIKCISAIGHIIQDLSEFLNEKPHGIPGRKNMLNEEYYKKMDAINYTLNHDDGKNAHNTDDADIILIGVSRSSKTPTSIYLSYRGYKVANIPFIHQIDIPINTSKYINKLIGLDIDIDRLTQVRRQRENSLNLETSNISMYADIEEVLEEIQASRSFFKKNKIKTINVTDLSIEEVASKVIKIIDQSN